MNIKIVLYIVILLGITNWTVSIEATQSDIVNVLVNGKVLPGQRAIKGIELPLHSVIVTPAYERPENASLPEAKVVISFHRGDLTPEFITQFFNPENKNVRVIHPFAARGVEAILKTEKLLVILHQGVALHLRNDLKSMPEFKTFRSDNVVGIVEDVLGEILISKDKDAIKEQLADMWAIQIGPRTPCILGKNCFKQEDGTFKIITPLDEDALIPYFSPRIEE